MISITYMINDATPVLSGLTTSETSYALTRTLDIYELSIYYELKIDKLFMVRRDHCRTV